MSLHTHRRHPMIFKGRKAKYFLSLFDDGALRAVAECIFVEGLTNNETADKLHYSLRQIERLRARVNEVAIKRLMDERKDVGESRK